MRLKLPASAAPTVQIVAPATGSAVALTTKSQLSQRLVQLQQSASVVSAQIFFSNKAFYEHLAELYLWWREAEKTVGYLDAEYAGTGKRFKKKIKQGINFAPLFWLTWGFNNELTDDKAGRWSRVLNKLHLLYESKKQYHTDSVAKLQNFIVQSGGVDGLVGYGTAASESDTQDDGDDDENWPPLMRLPGLPMDQMLAQLYGKASRFYAGLQAPATLDLKATVPLTSDDLSLVLVRKVGGTYQLIGASSDETLVKPVAMQSFLQDFSAIPDSIRVLVETVSTQCLPSRLQRFYSSLLDSAGKGKGKGKGKGRAGSKSVRRLVYLHESDEFLLSPIRANSGVVTVAKSKHAILENASKDVYLSTRSRRAMERRLIAGRDFNLYAPVNASVVPTYPHVNLASHALRVQNIFIPADYIYLDFWPFYDSMPMPLNQLIAKPLKVGFGKWCVTLGLAWFRKFALEFTSLWLESHGSHIKRAHQNVFLLTFGLNDLSVQFVYRGGLFECEVTVDFDGVTAAGHVGTVFVLSKDFAVAMQSVADLNIVSAVYLEFDEDVLTLQFSTTAADFRVFIPTCSVDGVRSEKHFKQYEPTPFAIDTFEDYNDQAEGDFDEEH